MQADSEPRMLTSYLSGCRSCFGLVGFASIFLLLGVGLAWWGWTIVQDARASAAWPTVEGRVTRSEVDESSDADGGDSYSPEVTYTYQVDDQAYENSTIKFGENSYSSRRRAEAIVANYPVGERVTVSYDPNAPGRSVLEPGVTAGSFIVMGVGAVFVVVSVLIVIISAVVSLLRRRV